MRLLTSRHIGLAALLCVGAACHSYVPALSAPLPGSEVAVVLTDKGRVALSDRIGPEIDQLRGRLVSGTDSTITLSMHESLSLRGTAIKWTDEVLSLSRVDFGSIRLKQLSKARSSAVAGTFGAAALFFVLNGGFGNDGTRVDQDPSKPPAGPGPSSKPGVLSFPFRSDF
jgi:hypothetical protein